MQGLCLGIAKSIYWIESIRKKWREDKKYLKKSLIEMLISISLRASRKWFKDRINFHKREQLNVLLLLAVLETALLLPKYLIEYQISRQSMSIFTLTFKTLKTSMNQSKCSHSHLIIALLNQGLHIKNNKHLIEMFDTRSIKKFRTTKILQTFQKLKNLKL